MHGRFLSTAAGAIILFSVSPAHAELPKLPQLRLETGGFDVQLTVGGAVQGAAFDDGNPRTPTVDYDFDLFARLNAQWTSPSGIIIGANIEQNNQDRETEVLNTGEVYGFISSNYGRLEIGLQDGPADTLTFAAPVIALGQVRGDFSRYAGSQALLRPLDTRDAFKVIYLSPPVKGLRVGVSWSPTVRQNANDPNPRDRTILRDAVELGFQFQRPVGAWVLGLSGGYVFGRADPITTRAGLNSWSIGAEARRGPLRIGGAYVSRGDSNRLARGFNQTEWNAGVGWVRDRWGVSVSTAFTTASDRNNRLFGLGAFYALSPNLQLRSDIVQFRERRLGLATEQGVVGIMELQLTI